ncbi:MAG: 1-acyl-sn-glycerol-3-phosphate acyltransferase [Myxococcales bacterium]|nr:1-acyl-sn-glycerol-3-phosphate acyltransferase [Myxococcales bacterium]
MTLWHLTRAVAETAWISVPTLLDSAIGRLTPAKCDARLAWWSRQLLDDAHIEIEVFGLELAPIDESFVIMSNHQSLYDIPVLFQVLKQRVRMVAKSELFKIPVWSGAMRAAGFVEVDRQNRKRAIASLKRAKTALAEGTSIWIAPEGTRSDSGRLGSFKKGGFHLALETGARILPITIAGTREVLVARTGSVRAGARVSVQLSAPIDPNQYGEARKEELMDAVRRAIAAHMPDELR